MSTPINDFDLEGISSEALAVAALDGRRAGEREAPSQQRWWFAFDRQRAIEADAEFVLA